MNILLQMIRSFHADRDPFILRKATELVLARTVAIVVKGKQKVLQTAGNDKRVIENIKKEWNYIQEI